ncbi:MAG: hypothetical protein KGJ55_03770 [Gammaproteobacteria bacterium]|nr:hypothetical protein [Gammaproteobacteria bacterium]
MPTPVERDDFSILTTDGQNGQVPAYVFINDRIRIHFHGTLFEATYSFVIVKGSIGCVDEFVVGMNTYSGG